MEQYNKNQEPKQEKKDNPIPDQWSKGRVWGGAVIVAVGTILIAREAGADIPRWLTSGPMFLIALGAFLGARSSFRNFYWCIPVIIGVALIVDREFWRLDIRPFIWPAIIVLIGLVMIFRPRRKDTNQWGDWQKDWNKDWQKANVEAGNASAVGEMDTIESVTVFGSNKKNILSKNFRGGEVVNFFGGTELNLSQADINGPVMLELTQVFGGSKLIVPANWRIQSELVSVFGGVDDKRMLQPNIDPTKVLVLKGTNVFGGLEIKSF
jgi:predicted membrane protein